MKSNKSMKLLVLAMVVIMSMTALASCDALKDVPVIGGLFGDEASATVSISQETAEIAIGDTLKLTATASDGSEVEWSSSDKTVVSVTRDGLIRGAKVGTATITAKAGEATATCVVTVYSVDVTISQTTATVEKDQTITLTAEAGDGGAILWISSDESIATVKDGVVTGLKEGTVTITARRSQAGEATCEVTVIWSDKPSDYTAIDFGEEYNHAVANPGTYYYWNDQNWCGSSVTAIDAYYGDGVATFQYSDASASCWHGYQVFYKHAANVAGTHYKLSATINSLEAGDISINGTVVSLQKGENYIEVYYVEDGGKASLSMQMGTQAAGTVIPANTISISNVKFEEFTAEKLAVPTAVSISSDNVVSITDPNGDKADAIKLNFYFDGVMLYSFQMKDGDTLDDTIMEDGEYEIKAVAVGSGAYESSDESAVLATHTVANGGVSYDMENLGEAGAAANPGKWTYWTEFSGITYAKYENGKISFDVSVEGGNWYSNQLFYKNSALQAGKTYTLTMKMTSTVAGQITINGNVVTLAEGDNDVRISYTEGNVSISIQMGTMDSSGGTASTIATGEFTIENIEFTDGSASVDPENPNAALAGGETDAIANPEKVYYWTEFVGIADATYDGNTISFKVVNGGNWYSNQIFLKKAELTAGKTYKLTLTIVSSVAEKITLNGTVIDLAIGENAVEVTYVEAADKASFSLQCGVNGGVSLAAGEFTLKDMVYTEVEGGNEGDNEGGNEGGEETDEPISYDIVWGAEGDAAANHDTYYYWNDQNWCGSNVTASYAHYDLENDKATFTYSGATSACWFGYQVFYKNSANEAGKTYKLTCTIISEAAGDVTINGQIVTLVAGENNIELTVTEAAANASFSLQCGNEAAKTVIAENTISISGLAFTLVEESEGGEDSDDPSESTVNEIVYGVEADAVANPGKVYYWTEWSGIAEATYTENEISFKVVNGGNWYSNQIFLKKAELTAGKTYKLTLTIVSSVAEKITLNGTVIDLAIGENAVEVTYVESETGASLSLQCGVNGGVSLAAGEFTLKDMVYTEVEGGSEGDNEDGNEGGESTETPDDGSYDIAFGDENGAVAAPDVWHFWNDQWWCGSNVTVSSAHYDAETDIATFTYSMEGSNWFGMQVFYKDSANETGKNYKLTCVINSDVAGDITINGQVVSLVAGDNAIEITVAEGAGASFSLQCGVNGGTVISAATISISDLTFTLVEENENEGETGSGNEGTTEGGEETVEPISYDIVWGAEGDAAANHDTYYYWNDQNWCGSNVIVSYAHYDAESDTATFTYSGATSACWHGMQIFFRNSANEEGKTYKLTCTITSAVAGDITIVGNVVTLVEGENNIELTVGQGGGASLALQCGSVTAGTVIAENTISISDLTFTEI